MFSRSGQILKRLVVLDFDHTVCEHNTDIVVRDLLGPDGVPPDVRSILRSCGWIPYMQRVFRLLHQAGFQPMDIGSAIRGIPEVPGMKACIANLVRHGFHVIIISDSNSEFIRLWNDFNDIGRYIHTVFTNPAKFDPASGLLELRPYHYQTECSLSSKNLCKGKIMDEFLRRQREERNVEYEKIFYAGDGKNDVCPMLRLGRNGYACARRGYACYDALQGAIGKLSYEYTAKVLQWTDGHELSDLIWTEMQD
ncbi:pyridoxal phosphate phosphatase PHOSPHO2-like [Anopheles aquasalis]|uniref:pyridoxal phosphate phosphatase PHOSPHO2-like n=1 Tax=Anopheles aquasalis TaxID=42839 RepID=UPI00215AF97E|nr:pyridoxal phosphate phosphatase PHOSPHO2-like [Anopheles aquasalis]XP_050085843.1 pyridoxal phosphate phosphatase PHOSPHO2-like [Anopheles aquasalis]